MITSFRVVSLVPPSNTICNAPNINNTYFIRRQLKTKEGEAVDVQNSYSKGQEVYVAIVYSLADKPTERIRTFSAGIELIQVKLL